MMVKTATRREALPRASSADQSASPGSWPAHTSPTGRQPPRFSRSADRRRARRPLRRWVRECRSPAPGGVRTTSAAGEQRKRTGTTRESLGCSVRFPTTSHWPCCRCAASSCIQTCRLVGPASGGDQPATLEATPGTTRRAPESRRRPASLACPRHPCPSLIGLLSFLSCTELGGRPKKVLPVLVRAVAGVEHALRLGQLLLCLRDIDFAGHSSVLAQNGHPSLGDRDEAAVDRDDLPAAVLAEDHYPTRFENRQHRLMIGQNADVALNRLRDDVGGSA